MKQIFTTITVLSLFILSGVLPLKAHEGKEHGSGHHQENVAVSATSPVEAPAACKNCNMDRTKFNYSRSLIEYQDGSKLGTCSINCTIFELDKDLKKKVKQVYVADFKTKKLIEVKSAVWVVGGSVRGVMTKNPKWAFADRKDAEAFIKENGGKISTYDEVTTAVKQDIATRKSSTKPGQNKH